MPSEQATASSTMRRRSTAVFPAHEGTSACLTSREDLICLTCRKSERLNCQDAVGRSPEDTIHDADASHRLASQSHALQQLALAEVTGIAMPSASGTSPLWNDTASFAHTFEETNAKS